MSPSIWHTHGRRCRLVRHFVAVVVLFAGRPGAANPPEPTRIADVEDLGAEYCGPQDRRVAHDVNERRKADVVGRLIAWLDHYDRAMREFLNADNVTIAAAAGDSAYFRTAACVTELFVQADVRRDWFHALLPATVAEFNRERWWPYAVPFVSDFTKRPMAVTGTELVRARERDHRLGLLQDLARRTIVAFGAAKDCRLADDLASMFGYSSTIDEAALHYMNGSCTGDRALADRVYRAVFAISWRERLNISWEAALQLVSATEAPAGYLSPVERIRRLWHAPISRLARTTSARGLVDDEERELDIVLRLREEHMAAMAELFDGMAWDAPRLSELDALQTHETREMLGMLEAMPPADTRQLLAEWYVRIDRDAPGGTRAIYLLFEILFMIGDHCVPSLADWMVSRLPERQRDLPRYNTADARDVMLRAVRYAAKCQAEVPTIRARFARLAAAHPGTVLRDYILGVFGASILDRSEPGSPPEE